MRLLDALAWLHLPPPELVDNAQSLEFKVRQICCLSSGAPIHCDGRDTKLYGEVGDHVDQVDGLTKKAKVALDIEIDTSITSAQWKELLSNYADVLADNKFNSRALASFTECLLMSIAHLALTPSVFTDLQDEERGKADYHLFLKQSAESIGPLVKHILDNASFVKRSAVESQTAFYGSSLFYVLACGKLWNPASLHFENQGWYTIARTLRVALQSNSTSADNVALDVHSIVSARPMSLNVEFGWRSEARFNFVESLHSVLLRVSTGDNLGEVRVFIDALLLLLPLFNGLEALLKHLEDKRVTANQRLNITLHQLRAIGIAAGTDQRLVDRYLLSRNGTGLLRPLLQTVGTAGSDFDDMIYRLLAREGSGRLVQRAMTFVNAESITNVCQKVFSNFDAKVWTAWLLALSVFPRRGEAEMKLRRFPAYKAGKGDAIPMEISGAADDHSISVLILGPICKQIQLQLRRQNHTGAELLSLLFCAVCCIPQSPSLWYSFAATHLQEIVLNCILTKFNKDEDTIEVFGKAIGVTSEHSDDVFTIIREYLDAAVCDDGPNVPHVFAQKLSAALADSAAGDLDRNVLFVLRLFELVTDTLPQCSVINLGKIDLSKLPDLVLVRFFEMSLKSLQGSEEAEKKTPLTSKMCAGLAKKVSQYFTMIDKLANPKLSAVYVAGLSRLFKKIFHSTPHSVRVRQDVVYQTLAGALLGENALVMRTFVNAVITCYVNNRISFSTGPTNDPLLNLILYFFTDDSVESADSVPHSASSVDRLRLSNYRHSDATLESFSSIIENFISDLLRAYCSENPEVMRDVCPKTLSFKAVGVDRQLKLKPKKLCREASDLKISEIPTPALDAANIRVPPSVSAPAEGEGDSVGNPSTECRCEELRSWLRSNRKNVGADQNLQLTLSNEMSGVGGFDGTTPVRSEACLSVHQELFKILCSIWADALREGCLQPELFVELVKYSPRILGRSISERQTSIVKALGSMLLGPAISYPVWGPGNQFDYKALKLERTGRRKRSSKEISGAPEAELESPPRPSATIRCWSQSNLRIVFGPWYVDWLDQFAVGDSEFRKHHETTHSILLDVLLLWLRMMYASVPLSARPDRLLQNEGERDPKIDPILDMLHVADKEYEAFPQLCEAAESVGSRRQALEHLHSCGLLATMSDLLTIQSPSAANAAVEGFQIVEELLALELYREKIFQIILKEQRLRLNKVIGSALTMCATLAFIRKNIICDQQGECGYRLLKCVPQMLREAKRGDWLFDHIISSYQVILTTEQPNQPYLSSTVRKLLWENFERHVPAVLRVCRAQSLSAGAEDLTDTRINGCLQSFEFARPPK